jgi:homoserine kinase
VSGAGPTVLAFTDASGAAALEGRCPAGWAVHRLAVDRDGARLS